MKNFVRDTTVHLKFNFYDALGNIRNPVGANVTFSYRPKNNTQQAPPYTFVTFALAQAGNDWTYDWDSSVASADIVYVHAQTNGEPLISSMDDVFRLTANRANKQLAGDDDTWAGYFGYFR